MASPLGGEGLDLHNIREIHLLEPWFHMNKVEQVIGRGIRNYSHYSLAPEKRNTTIYLHASVLTGSEKDRESVDLSIYRLAEKKMFQMATLEGVLKTNAIDCQLNKNGNFFAPQKIKIKTSQSTTTTVTRGDKPYSKGCLYQKNCQYQCEGFSDYTFNPSTSLDKNTYNIQFAKGEIEQVTRKIKEFFGQYFTATLERLQAYIDDTIPPTDPEIIYYSLQYLLDSREQWIDMYQRKGYLVYRSNNYLFQPVEFQEEGIPHQTRIKPIPWKNTHIEIPLTFFNSTDQHPEAKPVAPPTNPVQQFYRDIINNGETLNRQLETITAREETLTETPETPLKSLTLPQKNKLLLQRRLDHLDYSLFKSLLKVKPASIEGLELNTFYQDIQKTLLSLKKNSKNNSTIKKNPIYGFIEIRKDKSYFKMMDQITSKRSRGIICENSSIPKLIEIIQHLRGITTLPKSSPYWKCKSKPSLCLEIELLMRLQSKLISRI